MASLVELEAPPHSPGDISETEEQEGTQGARAPGTPLGALFRGASGAAGASDDRAQLREDGESDTPSAEDRSLGRRVSPQYATRAVSLYLRDDPDDGDDPHEDGFDQPAVFHRLHFHL